MSVKDAIQNVISPRDYVLHNDESTVNEIRRKMDSKSKYPHDLQDKLKDYMFTSSSNWRENVAEVLGMIGNRWEDCVHLSFGSTFMRAFTPLSRGRNAWRQQAAEECKANGMKMLVHYKTQAVLIVREDDWYDPSEEGEMGDPNKSKRAAFRLKAQESYRVKSKDI